MKTAKEKAIREAYGEHWDSFKDNVYSNGWIKDRDYWGSWPDGTTEIKWQTTDHDNDYYDTRRPMSLKGIETNQGWTRIESEADLPTEAGYYNVYRSDGSISENVYKKYDIAELFNEGIITHYRKVEPLPIPIY